MRAGPLLAALATSLRRNVAMTCAVVVTIAISLALLGAGLLLRAQAQTVDGFLLDQIEVVVDLQDGLPTADRQALRDELAADPLVVRVTYESKQAVYERFRRDFRSSPDVVAGVGPDDLPASFRLALTDPRDAAEIVYAYTGREGVEAVRDQRALLGPLYRFLDAFTVGAFALAGVQAAASFVLIYTMIRISAHARRRETAIMRLVGATNAAIRAPFVLESALAGLVGGLLAVGVLLLAKIYLVDGRFAHQTMFPLFGWDAVWMAAGTVLAVGVTAAAGMASVALRRHLRT
ncbi:cell division protein FtsX [Frankia sp. EI5c]|nr:cell division protein FtsX [Frankia sp. EI5c]